MNLAYQCFKLALTANNDHAESYNNLGVLEMRLFKFFQHTEWTLNESYNTFSCQMPMTNQTFTALQFPIITYLDQEMIHFLHFFLSFVFSIKNEQFDFF